MSAVYSSYFLLPFNLDSFEFQKCETEQATFSALGDVLHYLLIALKLCCNYLVPGDSHFMVDIVWMLLLGFIDLQACLHKNLQERKGGFSS